VRDDITEWGQVRMPLGRARLCNVYVLLSKV
jgi:hypothetical protein